MTIYIALLRGINVGGKNKVKMSDLKSLLESRGFARVETYIQSGNILFESDEAEETLRRTIESMLETELGVSSAVILRTADEWERLILRYPFSDAEIAQAEAMNDEGESQYVILFVKAPQREKVTHLDAFRSVEDEYQLVGRDAYLLLRHSIRNSKLANSLQKLDVPGTARNWKTATKLLELAKARMDSR